MSASLAEVNGELINSCLDDDIGRMKEIIKIHTDVVNIIGRAGYPPLHYAVFKQNYVLTSYLLHHGADSNMLNLKGSNAIHAAVIIGGMYNHFCFIFICISSCISNDFFLKDSRLLELLHPNCHNLDVKNNDRETPLDIARRIPSVADLQFFLVFQGWKSTDNDEVVQPHIILRNDKSH